MIARAVALGAVLFATITFGWIATAAAEGRDPTGAGSSRDDLPGDSLYQLPIVLTTSACRAFQLSELRGKPLIVTMFYSRCASVCPLLTARLQHLVNQLSPTDQAQIRVLMVSFDSFLDTPESLTAFVTEHHIQDNTWLVARAPAADVRALAAALGIQYRELADHTFNHTAVISVTDRAGVVRARTEELGDSKGVFLRAIRAQLASAHYHSARPAGAS